MFKQIQGFVIFFAIPIALVTFYAQKNDVSFRDIFFSNDPVIHIGDYPVYVEIVDTDETRTRGLSGREEVPLSGMLFIFDEPGFHGIWMKDMKFTIDVIWISEELRVIGITKGLTPESYPRIFEPPQKIKYAVETEPGYAEFLGIGVGDKVVIPNKHLR